MTQTTAAALMRHWAHDYARQHRATARHAGTAQDAAVAEARAAGLTVFPFRAEAVEAAQDAAAVTGRPWAVRRLARFAYIAQEAR